MWKFLAGVGAGMVIAWNFVAQPKWVEERVTALRDKFRAK